MGDKDTMEEDVFPLRVLDQTYSQIFAVEKQHFLPGEEQNPLYKCLLRVGKFVYTGLVDFTGMKMTLEDVPLIAACIQQQQGGLSYMCVNTAIPASSSFHGPVELLYEATDFFLREMYGDSANKATIARYDKIFPWINDDNAETYFQLALDNPPCMQQCEVIMSKTYFKELIVVTIWAQDTFYFTVGPGAGEQAVMDVRYPDCSKHGQGVFLKNYASARRDRAMARAQAKRDAEYARQEAKYAAAKAAKEAQEKRPKLLSELTGRAEGKEGEDEGEEKEQKCNDESAGEGEGKTNEDCENSEAMSAGEGNAREEESNDGVDDDDDDDGGGDRSACGAVYQRLMLWHVIDPDDAFQKQPPLVRTFDLTRVKGDKVCGYHSAKCTTTPTPRCPVALN